MPLVEERKQCYQRKKESAILRHARLELLAILLEREAERMKKLVEVG